MKLENLPRLKEITEKIDNLLIQKRNILYLQEHPYPIQVNIVSTVTTTTCRLSLDDRAGKLIEEEIDLLDSKINGLLAEISTL